MSGRGADTSPGADGDFSVAYWCQACPLTFRDAASSNAHHDATGHHQTWRPSQSFGERLRRARDRGALCTVCGEPWIAAVHGSAGLAPGHTYTPPEVTP